MSGFWPFVARKSFGALAAVVGVSLAVFALRHAVPGDPVDAMLGEQATDRLGPLFVLGPAADDGDGV